MGQIRGRRVKKLVLPGVDLGRHAIPFPIQQIGRSPYAVAGVGAAAESQFNRSFAAGAARRDENMDRPAQASGRARSQIRIGPDAETALDDAAIIECHE